MQISVHEIEHEIDVTIVLRTDDILQADDVLMARQLLQEDNLSECALSISCILKCIKVLLKSNDLLGLLINSFPHNTICALAYSLTRLVYIIEMMIINAL